jgi:hypothetical protein
MHRSRNIRLSVVAIATILAMLLVPACGSLCTAMTHCPTSTVSASSDDCHHAGMSAMPDSEARSLSSEASCSQQTPLFAIVTSPTSSIHSESKVAANMPLSIDRPAQNLNLNLDRQKFLRLKDSPQQSIPLDNISVLRI